MVEVLFEGWFQCRLATDPDPADEPRGISGMIKVYPGEPDLDRIIRFQPPVLRRSHTPEVGVEVKSVIVDGQLRVDHILVGAKVNLAKDPVFKGDNGIVAEDGAEPIIPFVLEIQKDDILLSRTHAADAAFTEFPYKELQAKEFKYDPAMIRKLTGIWTPKVYLAERVENLKEDIKGTENPFDISVLERRIAFLTGSNADKFFDFLMRYVFDLRGPYLITDPETKLEPLFNGKAKWSTDITFCAWDPDALSGYVSGKLIIY
ncbi:MAG: hypothetical protein V4687_14450 [Bacteroidota bacterium]